MRKYVYTMIAAVGLSVAPVAMSHLDSDNFHLSYRQSVFAILGANFGPMASMVKGEMPWNADAFTEHARDLNNASKLNVGRGFAPGTSGGKTRAKPAIWDNTEDVVQKWKDFQQASAALLVAAESGDRKATIQEFKNTGGTCKGCHDDYKSKDYLN